jgi:CHAD domain-containing protein
MKFLGKLRDLDVQIQFLKGVLADIHSEHKKELPGIKRLMLRCRQQWGAEHEKVVKAIAKIQKKHVLTEIHLEAESILFERQDSQTKSTPLAVIDHISRQLQSGVEDFRGRKLCLEQRGDNTGHHALRISAKQLRYEMEICDLILRGEFKDSLKKIKKIQTILGDLHDCVVWESEICEFIELEKQRTIDYYGHDRPFTRILPGLEFLKQNRKNHHDKLLLEVYDSIMQLDQEDFWDTFLEPLRPDKTIEIESSGDNVEEEKNNTHIDPDNSSSAGCACKPVKHKTAD